VEAPSMTVQAEARAAAARAAASLADHDPKALVDRLAELSRAMEQHAKRLEFEKAAALRDEIREIERLLGG